jgi:hypothetical protein
MEVEVPHSHGSGPDMVLLDSSTLCSLGRAAHAAGSVPLSWLLAMEMASSAVRAAKSSSGPVILTALELVWGTASRSSAVTRCVAASQTMPGQEQVRVAAAMGRETGQEAGLGARQAAARQAAARVGRPRSRVRACNVAEGQPGALQPAPAAHTRSRPAAWGGGRATPCSSTPAVPPAQRRRRPGKGAWGPWHRRLRAGGVAASGCGQRVQQRRGGSNQHAWLHPLASHPCPRHSLMEELAISSMHGGWGHAADAVDPDRPVPSRALRNVGGKARELCCDCVSPAVWLAQTLPQVRALLIMRAPRPRPPAAHRVWRSA